MATQRSDLLQKAEENAEHFMTEYRGVIPRHYKAEAKTSEAKIWSELLSHEVLPADQVSWKSKGVIHFLCRFDMD